MSEAYCVGRPPSRLLSHTARGLLQTPGGSSFSRPGTPLTVVAGDQSLRSTARGTARSAARSGSRGEPLKTSLASWPFAGRAAATESPGSPTLRPGRKQAYGVWCRQETPAISSSCPSLQVTGLQQLPQLQPEAGSKKQLQHTQLQQSDDVFPAPVFSSEHWPMFGESVEALAEEFNRDVKALDHQIHEFSKGLHLVDPVEAAERRREELDREALEAERKRREAELRKARKKEQQARDPHTKVALKLERTRRFPSESKKGQQKGHIPLQRVDVSGNRGLDVVELVDVRVLKSRCLALYEGARYESLLEEYNSRELKARWTPSASVGCLPFSKGLKKSGPEAVTPSGHQSYEERWNRAAMQRAQQNREKITKRLEEMRGPHTEEEVARLEAKVRANRRLASRPKVRLACQDRAKFKRLWATLRATVWWLLLMLVRRRRSAAIVVVKATLANCGEWLRIRLAMHRLSRNVVKLQQTARGFLELKRERLEVMEGHWERLEDEHLRSWYVTYGSKILDERMEQVSSQKFLLSPKQQLVRRNSRLVHAKIKEGSRQREEGMQHLNWKKFRIPGPLRWEVLSRYYSAALQKRIRIQGNIVAMMRRVVQSQREMDWYLSQFGAERSRASLEDSERDKEAAGGVSAPAFWQLTDAALLQLIGYCAKKLKDGKVDPFQAPYLRQFSKGTYTIAECLAELTLAPSPPPRALHDSARQRSA